jgi:hypothetical protein
MTVTLGEIADQRPISAQLLGRFASGLQDRNLPTAAMSRSWIWKAPALVSRLPSIAGRANQGQARRVESLGFAFQKFSKPDRHRPRIRVNHVPTLQVTDQTAIKIIQVVIKDDGNPRSFSIAAKNLSTSHDRDIYAGILIGD